MFFKETELHKIICGLFRMHALMFNAFTSKKKLRSEFILNSEVSSGRGSSRVKGRRKSRKPGNGSLSGQAERIWWGRGKWVAAGKGAVREV